MSRSRLNIEDVLGKKGIISRTLSTFEHRPQQLLMALQVEKALDQNKVLLIEAGTGVGKTLAYLIPALLSGKRVVLSTGTKTLQEQIARKEIPFLKEILPFKFKVSYLKGRSNYLCLYRYYQRCASLEMTQEHQGEFQEVQAWMHTTRFGDRAELAGLSDHSSLWRELSVTGEQCLGSRCENYNECFITQLRQEAMESDLLVVNHHLFFADLALRSVGKGEVLPPFDAIVFDEAHLLEEVAGPFFGRHLSNYRLEELERDCYRELKILGVGSHGFGHGLKHLTERKDSFFGILKKIFSESKEKGSGHTSREEGRWRINSNEFPPYLLEASKALIHVLEQVEEELSALKERCEGIHSLAERTGLIRKDLKSMMSASSSDFVSWVEVKGRGVFLRTTPMDVSQFIQKDLFEQETPIVLTSATLSINLSFDFLKRGLGIVQPDEVSLDSPFCFKEQLLYYYPRQMVHPKNKGYLEWVSGEIIEILKNSQGRAFVLVTSHFYLEELFKRCRDKVDFPLLKQGDKPKDHHLQEFQEEVSSVIFATTSFWQGIDIQGGALSCVIIVKLPFSSPEDPMTAGKIAYLKQKGIDPFQNYQLPKAIIQLKQGVGRLIRKKTDRGVVAILDQRLLEKPYGMKFLKSLPEASSTRERRDIREFLKGEDH